MNTPDKVRVRIAPSPTGNCHVGTARTALYNMLFARKYGGKFVLRIDDTDLQRSTKESEEGVLEGLRWLNIKWDEGPDVGGPYAPYRQMERQHTYRQVAEQLMAQGDAYHCYCTPEELEAERKAALAEGRPPRYSGKCARLTDEERARLDASGAKRVVRLKVPETTLSFVDLVRGEQHKNMAERGDFVIIKSDGSPVYNFATVVDEHLMEITHVFRAVEHLTNTFDQLAVYHAMGWAPPQFGHLTLMLNPDRTKISKRAGAVYIGEFREMGYLPEALVNFLALLGWNPGTDQEIFSMDQLVEAFSVETLSKSDAIFDIKKLDWFNGVYIRSLTVADLASRVKPFMEKAGFDVSDQARLEAAVSLITDRINKLTEAPDMIGFLFTKEIEISSDAFLGKGKIGPDQAREALARSREALAALKEWEHETVESALRGLADQMRWKAGDLLMQVRIAITGRRVTPPLFESLVLLGKDESLRRIGQALAVLGD
ncbi:MAG: glutamate--tRNA ligase [Firmicutes bacterium]|jgi:glutamyl-tRNA synthetase|nr:glutamate--tRNA ligase [Bacillota bacterium]